MAKTLDVTRLPSCKRHPGARAGWTCENCHASLCPDCVAEQVTGMAAMAVCCTCGGIVRRLMIRRSDMVAFVDRVLEAPKFPLSRSGVAAMAIVALLFTLHSYASTFMVAQAIYVAIVVRGIYWGYIFSLIRSTGRGSKEVTTPDFASVSDDIILPAFRGAAAALMVWVPAIVYVAMTHEAGIFGVFAVISDPVEILSLPVVLVLLIAGMAYLPMTMLAAATDVGLFELLNPVVVVRAIGRVGPDYWVTAAAMAILLPAMLMVDVLAARFTSVLPIPFVGRFVGQLIGMYVPFVMARILGLLLYVHGDVLDWGASEEYEEPVLPGASPRGALAVKEAPRESHAKAADEPATWARHGQAAAANVADADDDVLLLGSSAAMADMERVARITSEMEALAPRPPRTMAAVGDGGGLFDDIREAIAIADFDKALRLYAKVAKVPEGALAPGHHFTVGQAAVRARDFELAVRAFETAGSAPDPVAPKALVMLAQVYGDGMRDLARAQAIYRRVIAEHGGTSAARFAGSKLSRSG